MSISIKNETEIQSMRVAGKLAGEVLDYLGDFIKPGITTLEIDQLAHDYMVGVQGTIPASLNYAPPGSKPFPASLCTSINHQVCHGIPNKKPLKNGDIINLDVTPIKDGWHGDTSRMYIVGEGSIAAKRLCQICHEAMWVGIDMVRPGMHLGDIGHAIQAYSERNGYSVVREFCGHGLGIGFHEEPQVLHYGQPGTREVLQAGMTFTIEPMLNIGKKEIKMAPNDPLEWEVVTKDRSLSAQWEHSILVTESGYEVLTFSTGAVPPPDFVKHFVPNKLVTL